MIGCPQYQRLVSGSYECDSAGEYLLAPDGAFSLDRATCNHNEGKCMQTLCVLHRHSRRGERSWFPSKVVALPSPAKRRNAPVAKRGPDRRTSGGDLDMLC